MKYQKVFEMFWTDPNVKALPKDATLLFLYLITGPGVHFSGLYHVTEKSLSEGAKLSAEELRKALKTLATWKCVITGKTKVFAKYDPKAETVWVVNMAHYQMLVGNRANQIKGLNNHLRIIHQTPLIKEFVEKYRGLRALDGKGVEVCVGHEESKTIQRAVKETSSTATIAGEVVVYLNEKLGTVYKASSRETQKLIRAREAQGFGLKDFKAVIDKKVHSWKDDAKMKKFLRPGTLFGNKFESYLNELNEATAKEPEACTECGATNHRGLMSGKCDDCNQAF